VRVTAATSVLARAAVLLARHWPALVVIWVLGWLGREEAIRLAVRASEIHAVAGVLVLALAIVSEMAALVWMLRVVRTSAPAPEPVAPPPLEAESVSIGRWRRIGRRAAASLDSTAAVLIPFLAIYVSQDSFRLLFSEYADRVTEAANSANTVAIFAGADSATDAGERLPWEGNVVFTVAAIAFVVRWVLRRSRPASGSGWSVARSTLASYVEVVWLVLLVAAVNTRRKEFFSWVDRRRVVRAAGDVVGSFVDQLGALTDPIRWVWARVTTSLGALDQILLLPVATLTVAAVVYGSSIAKPPPVDVSRAALGRVGRLRVARRVGDRVAQRRARRLAEAQLVRTGRRFQPMVDGIRLLMGAGLVPMLLFCVVFGALQTLDEWMWHAWRWVLGPHETDTWDAASGTLGMVNDLIVGVLGIALIGAAVERVTSDERQRLAATGAAAAEAAASTDPTPAEPTAVTPA
jgi:hypothetical protein